MHYNPPMTLKNTKCSFDIIFCPFLKSFEFYTFLVHCIIILQFPLTIEVILFGTLWSIDPKDINGSVVVEGFVKERRMVKNIDVVVWPNNIKKACQVHSYEATPTSITIETPWSPFLHLGNVPNAYTFNQ